MIEHKKNQKNFKRLKGRERKLQLRQSQSKQKCNDRLSKLKGSRTIEQMNISKYRKQFVLPKLEEEKQKLQIIKQNKRSISIDEIKDHEKKYIQVKEKIDADKKKQAKEDEWVYTPPTYRSKSYQILLQEEKQMQAQKKQEEAKFKSTIQNNKAQLFELLKLKAQEYKPKKVKSPSEDQSKKNLSAYQFVQQRKQKGNSYLQEIRKKVKKSPKNVSKQIEQSKTNTQSPLARLTPQTQIEKYKKSQRKASKTHLEIINIHNTNINNIAKNQKRSISEKHKLLKFQADRMDELIQRKKFIQKIRKPQQGEQDQTMDIVMASIQAKLAIVNMHKANNPKDEDKIQESK